MHDSTLAPERVKELREKHYNATLVGLERIHDALALFRVRPDFPIPEYKSGQYTTLGLGYWEPRHPEAAPETDLSEKRLHRLARRAYSMSNPVADESGELFPPDALDFLEFYIVMVKGSDAEPPPALTPRLFLMDEGDRLHMGEKFTGDYTLDALADLREDPGSLVVFAGTGTGEGPHNHMIWELLRTGYPGRVASIICARYKADLAYEPIYRRLEEKFPNLSYHTLTTREADTAHKKVYVQDYIESGQFEEDIDRPMHPENTHVFLCGNPAMIGAPKIREGEKIWPEGRKGVIPILEERGFRMDHGKTRGNIHFEKYW